MSNLLDRYVDDQGFIYEMTKSPFGYGFVVKVTKIIKYQEAMMFDDDLPADLVLNRIEQMKDNIEKRIDGAKEASR